MKSVQVSLRKSRILQRFDHVVPWVQGSVPQPLGAEFNKIISSSANTRKLNLSTSLRLDRRGISLFCSYFQFFERLPYPRFREKSIVVEEVSNISAN